MNYEIIKVNENTWIIDEGGVRFFLLTGDKRALMIDSGMNVPNGREIAAQLTTLPVALINTHADRDHIAGNDAFDTIYMHPSEFANYYNQRPKAKMVNAIYEGEVLDLGNRPLEIIALPGHTPGSIAILDIQSRMLFSGDPIQDGTIFMFGAMRNLQAYEQSLERLIAKHRSRFDVIYPSHGSYPVSPDLIPQLISGARDILAGKITPSLTAIHDRQAWLYDAGVAKFLVDERYDENPGQ